MRGKPFLDWDDPGEAGALITGLVNDGLAILAACENVELSAAQADAVGLLALLAGQDVEPGEVDGTWRIRKGTAQDRILSTVATETRHGHNTTAPQPDAFRA